MSNEFDIDDILSEIKERKSREKGHPPQHSPLPPMPETEENTDHGPLYRTTFDELDSLIDRASQSKPDPQADAQPKASETPPSAGTAADKVPPMPSRPKTTKEAPTAERSRHTSVDTPETPSSLEFDSGATEFAPEFFQFEAETPEESPFTIEEFSAPPPARRRERKEKTEPEPPAENGAFDFAAFDEIAPLGEGRRTRREAREPRPSAEEQPMDFEGHVRPLTDKAKMRSSYADLASKNAPPPRPRRRPIPKEDTVDFATMVEQSIEQAGASDAFDFDGADSMPPAADSPAPTPPGHVASRSGRYVTPATGKSLKIEDIKRLDFSATSGRREHEVYYDDYPEDDFEEGSFLSLDEYKPTTDRVDVSREMAQNKVMLFARTAITGLLTFFLFYFSLAGSQKFWFLPLPVSLFAEGETIRNYYLTCTVLISLVLAVNIRTVALSLYNMVRMRANSETLSSLAVIAAVIQGVYAVRHADTMVPNQLNLYYATAAMTMLFTGIGRLSMLGRIQSNFKIVSSKLPKKGVVAADCDGFCYDIAQEDTDTRPTIAYSAKADFFTDFLSLSFSDRYDVGINRSVAPVCLLGALIIAFGTRFLAGDMFSALSALTATLCVCATLSVAFIESIPLGKLAKRLTPYGCMVSGNKAVEKFCDTHSVILNDTELFPEGHISLHGIKAFSGARLDEAILDAASVLCKAEGALSPLFLDMIGGDRSLLRKVDEMTYEPGMGISAWIDQRRVLIGNRMLMQNHGIMLPNDTYERENPGSAPGNPIYISNSGEVSARFLVDYYLDEELAYQLDQLGHQNRNLVVYTADPNINEQTIWEIYGYPLELITIMSADLHSEYLEMSAPKETLPAEIVYTGGAANYIAAILGTMSARSSILSATIIQLIQIALGYGLIAFMAFMGFIGNLSILQLLLYQAFWFVATLIIQQTRKI